MGKLPPELMEQYVFKKLGVNDPRVLIGPALGEDAAVIDIGCGKVLVVHNDAITGAVETLGWLAVNIVANDVAVTGARPSWFLMTLFLPREASDVIEKIATQVDNAAKELGIAIVGGHTEVTPGVDRPIAGTTAIGIVDRELIVSTRGAKAGDFVIMTKSAAIEGTAILCTDFAGILKSKGVPEQVLKVGMGFLKEVSVVKEALILAEKRFATAMHDPTEGGLLGGLAEVAYSSGKTIIIDEVAIPVAEETATVTRALSIDPLRLISSGALIATVPAHLADEAVETLKKEGIPAGIIGRVENYRGCLVELHRVDGCVERLKKVYVADEIYKVWQHGIT
ncbi:MAG: AIR synthase family protein [Thermofilaceae archaeon]